MDQFTQNMRKNGYVVMAIMFESDMAGKPLDYLEACEEAKKTLTK